jgi:hypothetical protein
MLIKRADEVNKWRDRRTMFAFGAKQLVIDLCCAERIPRLHLKRRKDKKPTSPAVKNAVSSEVNSRRSAISIG